MCFQAVAKAVTIGTGNTHQHPVSPSPTSLASVLLSRAYSVFVNVLSGVGFLVFIIELLKIWREDEQTDRQTSEGTDGKHPWIDQQI